jgi:hypothetical protein
MFAVIKSHGSQAPPSPPQAYTDGVVQLPLEQHPVEHDVASQMQPLVVHRRPVAHAPPPLHEHWPAAEQSLPVSPQDEQGAPSTPHAIPDGGEVHALFEQHPPAHEVPSQMQLPLSHR